MVFRKSIPSVSEGITLLSDVPDGMELMLKPMIGEVSPEDRFLYLVGVDTYQFGLFYRKVCKECDEINQLFYLSDDIGNGIVCPKTMFLFDNLISCKHFHDYFDKLEDPVDRAQAERTYSSTDSIAMTLSIVNSII